MRAAILCTGTPLERLSGLQANRITCFPRIISSDLVPFHRADRANAGWEEGSADYGEANKGQAMADSLNAGFNE